MAELKKIKSLAVYDEKSVYFGGNQNWYADKWMRMAGCGPTAASNIVWYLSDARKELAPLCEAKSRSKEECCDLMFQMFDYVRPGWGGVRKPSVLAMGLMRYAEEKHFSSKSNILRIPPLFFRGQSPEKYEKLEIFLQEALQNDLPTAFLNYSNGDQRQLSGWHWTTISAYLPQEKKAVLSDGGIKKEISLYRWWQTSLWGGALVWVNISSQKMIIA